MTERRVKPEEIRCAQDLNRLPILTKELLRNHSSRLLARNVSDMKTAWVRTGGTTGERVQICRDLECSAWASGCYERGLSWGGKTPGEPAINLYGGSLGIDRVALVRRLGSAFRGDIFISAYEVGRKSAAFHISKIRRSKCRFITGYPSTMFRLAVLSRELGEELKFSVAFPTAELLIPEWEETIRSAFNCTILPYYGCGEVNSLGFCAPGTTDYLVPEEHAMMEVMHADRTTSLYGEGQFIITDLDNYAMPIIRYANGDAGKICPPKGEWPFTRIERLDGRRNSLLMTQDGDVVSGVIGISVFRFTSSVKRYRIIQEEPLRITVKIVPKGNEVDEGDERIVRTLFSKYLGSKMKINIEIVPELPAPPSGKSVFVINHCLD